MLIVFEHLYDLIMGLYVRTVMGGLQYDFEFSHDASSVVYSTYEFPTVCTR